MLISAFTFVRNADKYYFPIEAAIRSALPIADEMVVALGKGDEGDKTEETINNINSPKLKIFQRIWDPALFANSKIFAHETDFALAQCKGTWCLYLQADEVLHEDDLQVILEACKKYEHDLEVEGLLFDYVHFWGDYNHVVETHGMHRCEVRVIRNNIGLHSYLDALSFRKANNEKPKVVKIPARIFHYGHVRPPYVMSKKAKQHIEIHHGPGQRDPAHAKADYDWGPLGGLKIFKGTHPAVMKDWIAGFDWPYAINHNRPKLFEKSEHKFLRTKYRFMTWLEKTFNNNKEIFGYKSYSLLKR